MTELVHRELAVFMGLFFLTVFLSRNALLESRIKKLFFALIACEFLEMAAFELEQMTDFWTEPSILRIFLSVVSFSLRPLVVYFILLLNRRNIQSKRFAFFAFIPAVINCLLLSTAFFSNIVFGYTADNRFVWGKLGYLFFAFFTLYIFMLAVNIFWNSKNRWNSENAVLFIIIALFSVSMHFEMQLTDNSQSILRECMLIGVMAYYIYFQTHYLKEDLAEEKQKRVQTEEDNRITIMLSQIQPHFLFNSLNSICYLIHKDPAKAEVMLVQFSGYLRKNLDSLKQEGLVTFESELKHTEVYLSLEQLRFKERLNVIYDITCSDFLLPSLILQPAVENAVRHGVGRKDEGGTVVISTQKTQSAYIITISDDGVGFDSSRSPAEDGRSHVGMENIRARLHSVTNGSFTVESELGKGTTAVITIPREDVQ